MAGAGRRHDPLGDLALEHQGEARPDRWPGRAGDPVEEKLRTDIVGQVCHHLDLALAAQRSEIEAQRVGFDDVEPTRIALGDSGQGREAARILLDGDDLAGALGEKRTSEAAGTRADLDDLCAFEWKGLARNAGR